MAAVVPRGLFAAPLAYRVFGCPSRLQSLSRPSAIWSSRQYPLGRRLPAFAMSTVAPDSASSSMSTNEKEESEFWKRVVDHQNAAKRLTGIEEARIVVDQCQNGYISTFSQRHEGFPYGSYIDYAADNDGSLIISVSSLSPHTKDLEANPNCCLLIMKDKLDRSDILVTYMGKALEVPDHELNKARDVFLSKHPHAFWVDFGDFKFMCIQPEKIYYASGIVSPFNRTGEFSGDEFRQTKLDAISQFSTPIAVHMNKDHSEETKQIVEGSIGVKVESAKIIDLDTLGLNVQVVFQGKPIKLRVPFPRPAESRKDVKDLIVKMLEG
ncbi:hypothetical protein KP509_19G075100 [Ceratopteris richardii]|uniref:DUF2470 domain-containing protein n=1 Tax=Ceratopteris richardii TaxID=49495 RepID=A0A8T2SPV9_CERRI|nr:hypothetical protein KP509_19G075100 [Ceratopteris richardii]KAH7353014.1 hypothetical protein KP509_19G075100 [Ceratopteris richardii]KAH7353015.1 hypothetical protein KP509_19G075100 [Ceratopteris richardii]